MLLRADGGGQLIVLRALRAIEDRGWMPAEGVTGNDVAGMVQRPFSTVYSNLRRAADLDRACRRRGPKRVDYPSRYPPYYFTLTDIGRGWIDVQERYGAPPDPFRDPHGYARWMEETEGGRLVPMLVQIDTKTGKVLQVLRQDPEAKKHLSHLARLTAR